ncbi:MAG: M48 family metallopeptidase [Ornithinimicrobium sp.]
MTRPLPDEVEIRRSARRRRTVSARIEGERIVVLMPSGLSDGQERRHVEKLVAGLRRQRHRRELVADDLLSRVAPLVGAYLPDHPDVEVRCRSVRWVSNQQTRWGSCTPSSGTIRITDRIRGAPAWVVDAVLLHELAHLVEPGHGPAFRALMGRYPRYAQAQAFLAGVAWQAREPG